MKFLTIGKVRQEIPIALDKDGKYRKKFRTSVIIRNIYSEVLHITQSIVMKKVSSKKINKNGKQYLQDALITSTAGISAAMKNTG